MSSMFGRPQALSGGGVNSEKLEAATVELEMVSDMFNRLVRSCHAKCVDRHYLEETLNKGEGVCADRCVSKWFSTNELIGERMQAQGSALQAQQGQPAQPEKKGWFS
ncbi:hypothetical protein P389DRAFT_166023 [Cystobasidium minutum MCA 4210]|uniref:uncharacterized protein n=1 Tax=Cystobasidium minutum MCA 4210 TaxID=1397322 RepID=UPI0034D016BE|eukprot:jgi/Rhomi1/166023/fgenesh1_kg.1_\